MNARIIELAKQAGYITYGWKMKRRKIVCYNLA